MSDIKGNATTENILMGTISQKGVMGGSLGTVYGKDGKDGISVTHSWKGTVLTISSASGTSSADLKGDILKGYSNGGVIRDISPNEHNIICRIKRKNNIPSALLDLANWSNVSTMDYISINLELEAGKTYCLTGYSRLTSSYGYFYLQKSNDGFASNTNVIQLFQNNHYRNGETFIAEEGYQYRFYFRGTAAVFNEIYNLMIEEGTAITEYAPYLEDLTKAGVVYANNDKYEDSKTIFSDSSGNIEGIVSHSPLMSFRKVYTGTEDISKSFVMEITYNRDINKALEEIKNAIISLGGNV